MKESKMKFPLDIQCFAESTPPAEPNEPNEPTETIEKTVAKTTFDKTASELAEYKRKYKAQLTADEQAKIERDEKDARIKELESTLTKSKLSTGLLGKGFSEKEVASITDKIVEGNFDELIVELGNARISAISNLQKEVDRLQLEATKLPAEGDNGSGGEVSRTDFAKMSIDERQTLKNDNPELYASLRG